jgi:tetratricopeptide (TPR) repeat protein
MRIGRSSSVASLIFCAFFLLDTVRGQDADWDRVINAGDKAMANHQYADAESSYRNAVAVAEKRWKKDARISVSLFKLAEACNAQGKQQEAEALAKSSSTSMDETLKAHKPKNSSDVYQQVIVSTTLFDKVAALFAGNQNYHDAESMDQKSLKTWQEYVSAPSAAEQKNESVFRFWIQVQENAPAKYVAAGMKLAALYRNEGKIKEAKALYQGLAANAGKLYDRNDVQGVASFNSIATGEFQLGDYAAAEPLLKRVIDALASSKYKDTSDMASALENYVVVLRKTGRDDAAKPFVEKAALIRANLTVVPH